MKPIALLRLLLASTLLAGPLRAQDAETVPTPEQVEAQAQWQAFLDSLAWQTDGAGDLSEWATIHIPEGYRFLEGADAAKLMEAYGNLPDNYEGLIAVNDLDWLVLFEFDNSGYVKDDEKDDLDPDKLLKTLQADQEASNTYREQQGLQPMYIDGWAVEPRYNQITNNLEWGLLLRSGSSAQFVNYKTKLLGRDGLMDVTLICDLQGLQAILPAYQDLLLGHQYKEGRSYGEYRKGDKLAEYGLTALIAGGAAYGAAKLGLLGSVMVFFKKFLKFIVIGLVAIGVGIKKFFARMAGKEVRDDRSSGTPS